MRYRCLTFLSFCSIAAFAGPLPYSTSNGVSTNAALSYTYGINDFVGSSSIAFSGVKSGSTYVQVPFTFSLALPTISDYILNSASLTFSGTASNGSANASATGGSAGSYVTGSYPIYCCCDSFGGSYQCGTGYNYSNSYTLASASFNGSNDAVLTGISDGTTSVSLSSTGGVFDLASLGFGNDLLAGGSLTLTGYREVSSSLLNISYPGFNALTNFGVSYNGSGSESGTLNLDGTPAVPEPRWGVMMLAGIAVSLAFVRRKRSAAQKG